MIQTVVEFFVIFATVLGVFMVVDHRRAVALEARHELIAQRARQQ